MYSFNMSNIIIKNINSLDIVTKEINVPKGRISSLSGSSNIAGLQSDGRGISLISLGSSTNSSFSNNPPIISNIEFENISIGSGNCVEILWNATNQNFKNFSFKNILGKDIDLMSIPYSGGQNAVGIERQNGNMNIEYCYFQEIQTTGGSAPYLHYLHNFLLLQSWN
ncbi:MAG: hypothetical protein EZS28_015914 [Streblomastix strix]|uniref:Uncharacterized protein n=1 Tax=Streblomastix strix TaxID=222440 RepID=A0A5J4W200_9EUKA|nr:MAG: hypothetical protein EZS28_015914 [Streblomastix strix]